MEGYLDEEIFECAERSFVGTIEGSRGLTEIVAWW